MLPIIIAGTALLILSGGRKKRKKSSSPERKANGIIAVSQKYYSDKALGEPWSACSSPPGAPKGTESAVSKDGMSCMVFWDPDTSDIVRQHIQLELSKLSKDDRDSLCAMSKCETDPFTSFCDEVPDINRMNFIKSIVLMLWPQINQSLLPLPVDTDEYNKIPHFVKFVWTRVSDIFSRDFCGFNPVT